MRCNPGNMRLWIKALRSGTWEQGHGYMMTVSGKACCMGVVCEVAIATGLPMERAEVQWALAGGNSFSLVRYGSSVYYPPPELITWLGLEDGDWQLSSYPGTDAGMDILIVEELSASEANDERRLTFAEIADRLEERYLPHDWAVTLAQRKIDKENSE